MYFASWLPQRTKFGGLELDFGVNRVVLVVCSVVVLLVVLVTGNTHDSSSQTDGKDFRSTVK